MPAPLRISRIEIIPLAIPMRFRFEHAAAARAVSDPVVVRLIPEPPYSSIVGYGETLARRYVTGETAETVCDDVAELFTRHVLDFRASSFSEAVSFAHDLPAWIDGRLVNAARCAVELAVLDLAGRVFERKLSDATGWLDLQGFKPPGCIRNASCSGFVIGNSPKKLAAAVRIQKCYGLRDFKIKVAANDWRSKLELAHDILARDIDRGRVTLRADANSGWTLEEALEAVPFLERCGVSALEQPLAPGADDDLEQLAQAANCDLIADESLLTVEDAAEIISAGAVKVLNVRLAKNGGLIPSLLIARQALSSGLDVQLGCLVGETSILAAAGAAFLEACPKVRFVEAAYAPYLLRGDVTRRPLRFRRKGRLKSPQDPGHGVCVDENLVERFACETAKSIKF